VKKNVLLDTWAILALLYAEEPAATRVRSLLLAAGQGHIQAFLTLINLGEIYYTVGKRRGLAFAQQILLRIRALPVAILLVDE
jgi:predicted nucleic acid-binding protein